MTRLFKKSQGKLQGTACSRLSAVLETVTRPLWRSQPVGKEMPWQPETYYGFQEQVQRKGWAQEGNLIQGTGRKNSHY